MLFLRNMKTIRTLTPRSFTAALGLLAFSHSVHAGSFFSDFNSGLPAGTTVNSTATISTNDGTGGGYTNSGCLKLTTASGSGQQTSFIITNDLDSGTAIASFTASFKLWLGTPFYDIADG